MKKLLIAFIAVTCLFITGCGKKDLSKYVGTYEGKYVIFVGDIGNEDAKDTEEFKLVLESNGKGVHYRGGTEYNVTWDVDGDKVTMKETFGPLSIDYHGTLKDNTLELFNDEDDTNPFTAKYVYEKK